MKLIIGLGNPGEKYQRTRHNVGFMVLDRMIEDMDGEKWKSDKRINSQMFEGNNFWLVKPQTFMNRSGLAVQSLVQFYKVDLNDLYVVHDDLDIKLGEYKIQLGKGPKVHNGVNSIEQALGNKDFWRVRVGIDNRSTKSTTSTKSTKDVGEKLSLTQSPTLYSYGDGADTEGKDYVLKEFLPEERLIVNVVVGKVAEEIIKEILLL